MNFLYKTIFIKSRIILYCYPLKVLSQTPTMKDVVVLQSQEVKWCLCQFKRPSLKQFSSESPTDLIICNFTISDLIRQTIDDLRKKNRRNTLASLRNNFKINYWHIYGEYRFILAHVSDALYHVISGDTLWDFVYVI